MNCFKLIIAVLLINFFVSLTFASTAKDTLKAHKVFSITINRQIIAEKLRGNRMNISFPLNIEPSILSKCQIIGGISQLDVKGNPNIQFYFTYQLLQLKSSAHVQIFFKNNYSLNQTEKFLIILDFLVAQFPEEYFIKIHNITSYQEHVTHHNERSYDMLFLLNGFNNLSISGNITHSYQQLADLYTIHYMSCEGQNKNMGYREGEDYLLYTLVVVPYKYMIQKFKLLQKTFSIDFPKGFKYFYGLKGTIQPQFSGLFYQRAGGVVFKTQNLGKSMTYALAFLAYPDQEDVKDLRSHSSKSIIYPIIIIILSVPVCLVTFCFLCRKRMYFLRNILNEEENMEQVNQTETTKTDLGRSDLSRPKYQINTVPEVDEKYEVSYKTSHQPSFAVNQ